MFVVSGNLAGLICSTKHALHIVDSAAAMRHLVPATTTMTTTAATMAWRRRLFSTTTPLHIRPSAPVLRTTNSGGTNKKSGSGTLFLGGGADGAPSKSKKPTRNQSSKMDARLEDRDRVDSVSNGHDPKTRIRLAMNQHTGRHDQFRKAVLARFQTVLSELEGAEFSVTGVSRDELNRQAGLFMNALDDAFLLAQRNISSRGRNPLFWNLREAFITRDAKGVTNEIRYAFQSFMVRNRFSKGLELNQQRLLDLRFPQEWFPGTREMQRKVHVHVGPTNSGKTYNAIKALEKSRRGVYAGPLRLLATEVYQRFTAKGLPCALLTGEEVRIPKDTDRYFSSCTVEMIPLNSRFDVAVIDEIQMLSDPDRGSAWTTALLGVQADEVHVCGEERAVNLVRSLCASVGDECIVHRYERLSPLRTMDTALDNDFSKLRKGDAVVAFNRLSLHALKRSIEKYTGRRCAIIYGTLPPEVRVQQAALFNDPDNDYDFVVASDAIGMGLNLEIKRVILDSVSKFDGSRNRRLTYPEIKQIGGRAGRYRSANNPDGKGSDGSQPNVGYVTTMEYADLRSVQTAFRRDVDDLEVAYIAPPPAIVERFASYYPPSTPLSFILNRIRTAAVVGERFRLSVTADSLQIADIVQDLPLSIYDKLTLCNMPVRIKTETSTQTLRALAEIIANNDVGDLLSIREIPLEYLEIDMSDTKKRAQEYLAKMEALHTAVNQYVWLSYRYAGMFRNQGLAFHIRTLVEQRLSDLLDRLDFTDKDLEKRRRIERARAQMQQINLDPLDGEEEGADGYAGEAIADSTPEVEVADVATTGQEDAEILDEMVEASKQASYLHSVRGTER
ncbi:ATP-dependent RNA helicase SUPV3L1/SUV3 [Geosmithia morbida]|uniref:RNA helicase n=1 Tax=Geosmithia morbida TaxID=1094350 RepID=A0A9P4YWF7_9HYPO|nr:ATP-dependent RNA helicase SUPV3L1/SUV3 [Geosmithia morbida]KAF4123024.1 ATP-dependent RNA helicase SUPV3L1/SUV3 [Geosmithia morbida]